MDLESIIAAIDKEWQVQMKVVTDRELMRLLHKAYYALTAIDEHINKPGTNELITLKTTPLG